MKTRIALLLALVALPWMPGQAKENEVAKAMRLAAERKAEALTAASRPTQAEVSVDTTRKGNVIPETLFSQNVNVYEGSGDGKDAAYNAAVTSMGAKLMRFPGGGYSEFTDWENYKCGKLSWLPIDMAKGIAFAKAAGCHLQICVNAAGEWNDQKHSVDEAVAKAAKWVQTMNVKPGLYYTTWWEFGNEDYDKLGNTAAGGTEYGERYVKFYKAMKKVDPKIKFGFQCQHDKTDFTAASLQVLKKAHLTPDFLIEHVYPIWMQPDQGRGANAAPTWDKTLYANNPYVDARILDIAGNFPDEVKEKMDKLVADNLDPKLAGKIPVWVTEFRSVLELKYDDFVDSLFCAQVLLKFADQGVQGANIWDLKNGYNAKNICDFGLLRSGANAGLPDDNPKDSPRPTYYIYPYLAKVFGRQLVACDAPDYAPMDTPGNKVRAWASKDAEGDVTVFLFNNSPDAPAQATVKVAGFATGTEGKLWTLESAGKTVEGASEPILQRRDITVNGQVRPDPASLPGPGSPIPVGNTFSVTLAPGSMALVKVPKGNGPILAPPPVVKKEKKSEPAEAGATASAAKPLVAAAKPGEVILQDFSMDDKGAFSPWKDDKGSALTYEIKDLAPGGKPGEKMIAIKYNHVGGGWCGLFSRAGDDWAGLEIGKPKSLVMRIYTKDPVEFGMALADDAKVEIKLDSIQTQGGKWETVTVPIADIPPAFSGKIPGFNLYLKTVGEGEIDLDRITLVK